MPITLPPISRRRFLVSTLAGGAALALRDSWGRGASENAGDHIALLSDTHIAADPAKLGRGINMTDHLRQVCDQLLKLSARPDALMLNGDCAFNTGEAGDYVQFVELLRPVRRAGIPLHLALGNHDHREHFWHALAKDPARQQAQDVSDRQVLVVEMPRADWIMLDSLDKTNSTPGVLGPQQVKWLAATLDERARNDKPAIVMVHHHPQLARPSTRAVAATAPATAPVPFAGLIDSQPLLDVILPRKQVKLLLFGHTHQWHQGQLQGMHLINLPATAYVFKEDQPSAWIDCKVRGDGATLKINCLSPAHPLHNRDVALDWRS